MFSSTSMVTLDSTNLDYNAPVTSLDQLMTQAAGEGFCILSHLSVSLSLILVSSPSPFPSLTCLLFSFRVQVCVRV